MSRTVTNELTNDQEKERIYNRNYMRGYLKTENGQKAFQRYNSSEKGKARDKAYVKRIRQKAMMILGGKCVECGEPFDPNAKKSNLEFHHIYYTGHFFSKILALSVIKNPEQFKLICRKCHFKEHRGTRYKF